MNTAKERLTFHFMFLHAFAIFCSTFQHASWCANVVLPGETLRGAGGQIAEGAVLTMFDPAVTSLSVERTPSIRHTLQGLYWRCKLLQEFQSNEKTVQHLDKWKYQLNTWQAETWLRDSGDLFWSILCFPPQIVRTPGVRRFRCGDCQQQGPRGSSFI